MTDPSTVGQSGTSHWFRIFYVYYKLAVGDGALVFWRVQTKCHPDTTHQRCWVHKTANVLIALPKSGYPKVKDVRHEIWMAETRNEAHTAFDRILVRVEAKYPKTMVYKLLEVAQKK